jgi:hypothetical protein
VAGGLGDGAGLGAAEHAAGQLDPADATVQRLNDAQQAGARAGAWYGQIGKGLMVAQRVTNNYDAATEPAELAQGEAQWHRYTPPDVGTRD